MIALESPEREPAEPCDSCAEGARCDRCGDRLCSDFGPEPRVCATTCANCPCDCTSCLLARADMIAEAVALVEREGRL
mgnify:CR=1 FL=1